MTPLDQALTAFAPISLDSANEVAELQTRIDRKYIVDEATLCGLLAGIDPATRVLTINGERGFGYHSTYFDTEDLSLFRAAAQGRRERYKVRSRTYGEAGPCFLEVKSKGRRGATVKSRIDYNRREHDIITSTGNEFVSQITGRRDLAATLQPVLTTEYQRTTLIDHATQTRMTLDRGLRCTDRDGRAAGLDAIVVETKSARDASAADEWLWRHRVRPTKISKFCTGLATIRPELPANKWHRVIARHWRVQLPATCEVV